MRSSIERRRIADARASRVASTSRLAGLNSTINQPVANRQLNIAHKDYWLAKQLRDASELDESLEETKAQVEES